MTAHHSYPVVTSACSLVRVRVIPNYSCMGFPLNLQQLVFQHYSEIVAERMCRFCTGSYRKQRHRLPSISVFRIDKKRIDVGEDLLTSRLEDYH